MLFENIYRGKKVFVTGHTGFKGSWLSEWLSMMGAEVTGYSLKPDSAVDRCYTTPYSHFNELGLRDRLASHLEGDVRNQEELYSAIEAHRPDFLFHLAAQPLVLRAYEEPRLTMETNLMGTVNVLEAVRQLGHPCVCVMVTTDKVYENEGWEHSYREPDKLGGHDTYSASKACADIAITSYWRSFFEPRLASLGITVAAVRGGNVIGGGDWAENRIVPDAMRALSTNQSVQIRNRHATRPWQHVLEPLSGYLQLGALIHNRMNKLSEADGDADGATLDSIRQLCSPFNFGPFLTANRPVAQLVEEIFKHWPGTALDKSDPNAPREAGKLNLTIDKAHHILGWLPKWDFPEAIGQTVRWYRTFYEKAQGDPDAVQALTRGQIEEYVGGLSP